ncbi:S1 RNA-binding domain-containing protein, partial [Vibrio breoganii]
IKYLIAKQEGRNQDRWTPTGGFHYSFDDMDVYGEQCSMTERRADDATRDVADWLKCEYMQDHVGEELDGVIANVTGFGFFVRLTELHIDGLVHISALANDYYRYDAVSQRLVGESSGQIYRLGDQVKVKVLAVNLNDKQIDFELAGTVRTPKGKGKTAKKRLVEEAKRFDKKKEDAAGKGRSKRAKTMVEPTVRPDGSSDEKPASKKRKSQKARKSKARSNKNKARDSKK